MTFRIARVTASDSAIGVLPGSIILSAAAIGFYIGTAHSRLLLIAVLGVVSVAILAISRAALSYRGRVDRSPISPDSNKTVRSSNSDFSFLLYCFGCLTLATLLLRPLMSTTVSDLAFLVALVVALAIQLLSRNPIRFQLPGVVLAGAIIYSIGASVASAGAESPLQSFATLLKLLYLAIAWFWLTVAILDSTRRIEIALRCWVISSAVTGLSGVLQLLDHQLIPGSRVVFGRAQGFTGHPNDLGAICAIATVPALWLAASNRRNGVVSLAHYAAVVAIVAGLLASGSVSSMIAAGLSALVWYAIAGPWTFKTFCYLVFAGVGLLAILHVQQNSGGLTPSERIQQVRYGQYGASSSEARIEAYGAAWNRIARNPLIGVGLEPGGSRTSTGLAVHNAVLGAWFEAGIAGALGMSLLLAGVLHVGLVTVRCVNSLHEWRLSLALLASCSAFFVYAMTAPALFQRYGWVPAALLIAMWAQQHQRSTAGHMHVGTKPLPSLAIGRA